MSINKHIKQMTIQEYDISPLGYLKRAGQQLQGNTTQSIFYAALELRCAIEARAKEQLLSLKKIPTKIIKLWHAEKIMTEMKKRIGGAMNTITFHFNFKLKKEKIIPFTYKPIDKKILIEYGKLGNLLHAQGGALTAEVIRKNKRQLQLVLKEINERCKGHMLHPPEWKIRCIKCNQYLPMNDPINVKDLSIICKCGYKNSLRDKELKMTIRVRKKSAKSVELVQAERIED